MSRPLTPDQLHLALEAAPSITMRFHSRKKMLNYRSMLYKVNSQGMFRYSTRQVGWAGLMIIRLK